MNKAMLHKKSKVIKTQKYLVLSLIRQRKNKK